MGKCVVRFANREDLAQVNVLREMVNRLHVQGRPDIFRPGFCRELQERIYTILESPAANVIVAEQSGKICGFATVEYLVKPESPYNLERKYYHIEEFGVDESCRRQGIAASLIEFCKKDARERGFDRIELDAWAFNEGALQFYDAIGFETYRRFMELYI